MGVDEIMGCGVVIFLPYKMVHELKLQGKCTLNKIFNPTLPNIWQQGWLGVQKLGLIEGLKRFISNVCERTTKDTHPHM